MFKCVVLFTQSLLRSPVPGLVLTRFLCRILQVKVNDLVIAAINTLKYAAYRRQLFLKRTLVYDIVWYASISSTSFGPSALTSCLSAYIDCEETYTKVAG
jgi:hypothetical protein